MSLRLMRERLKISGRTPREEMIRDGQNLLKEELEHDSSYSPTMFFYDSDNKTDDRLANLRIHGRNYSSLNGNYMSFITTYDNPVRIGDYIHDVKDNTFWLVYNSFNVNDIQYEGKLIQCNYPLKWQLSDGKIIERWANIVSASKYDTGETGNSNIVLTSNNFTVLIGFCEEGYELEGKRVFIDKRAVEPKKVFKMTRSDDVLFDSGNMGSLLSFIADKTELNKDTDRQDLKLCDYINVENNEATTLPPTENVQEEIKDELGKQAKEESEELKFNISGNSNLKVGFSRAYTATITDFDGNNIDWNDEYSWNVVSDFYVGKELINNKIKLLVDDDSLIGESFLLQLNNGKQVVSEIKITIVGVF